jgi:hypothetical protein
LEDALDIPARLKMEHSPPRHPALPHTFVHRYLPEKDPDSAEEQENEPDHEEAESPVQIAIHIFAASQLGLGTISPYTLYEMALAIDPNRNCYRPDTILRARTYIFILCALSKRKPTPPREVGVFYERVKLWLSQLVLYDLQGYLGEAERGEDGYL